MEKTIKIDGKDVRLKVTAAFPLHFNALTGKDYLFDDGSSQKFYDTIWVAAKCADSTIPDVMEWVESFNNFPVIKTFNEVTEFIAQSIATRKNVKAATEK